MTAPSSERPLAMYIDGAWVPAASGATFPAVSPATGEPLGDLPLGDRPDAIRAIEAANRAARSWARTSPFERAGLLAKTAELIESRAEALARALTLDQGKPIGESRGEVEELVVYFRMAAADATRLEGRILPSIDAAKRVLIQRVPRGVVGVITPWNWPYTMPGEVLAPALAAGNTVVWNPASNTSFCAIQMAACLVDAGFPAGVFNLVTGPGRTVGDEIAGNPGTHAIGFIGSVEAGQKVANRAAGKELLLEMGGNGPVVVLADADLDAAVAATLTACFLNAGQSCTAGERILVERSVHDAYVAKLTAALARELRFGDPFDAATTIGPLNNEETVRKTEAHVADALAAGATLVAGGRRSDGPTPLYFEPTVLDGVTEAMAIAREETFGPVAPITPISGVDEAIEIVNASPYGLLSAVFTADLATGLRFAESVRSGWVNVNEGTNYWESHLPFGGAAASNSGLGRAGGHELLERFTELKTIVLNVG